MTQEIALGDLAQDTITGFTGVVICVSQWLHGCRRLTLQPRDLKDGKPIESVTFDEPQLLLLTPKLAVLGNGTIGGPRPEPVRR